MSSKKLSMTPQQVMVKPSRMTAYMFLCQRKSFQAQPERIHDEIQKQKSPGCNSRKHIKEHERNKHKCGHGWMK